VFVGLANLVVIAITGLSSYSTKEQFPAYNASDPAASINFQDSNPVLAEAIWYVCLERKRLETYRRCNNGLGSVG
jgi:hypothetical protein